MSNSTLKITENMRKSHRSAKREKFIKLAEGRTIKAIKAIRIIGNLGNRNAYEYSEADVGKIIKALNEEIDALKNRLRTTSPVNGIDFKL